MRYMYLDDLNKSNFTKYSSGNVVSFMKLLIDTGSILGADFNSPSPRNMVVHKLLTRAKALADRAFREG